MLLHQAPGRPGGLLRTVVFSAMGPAGWGVLPGLGGTPPGDPDPRRAQHHVGRVIERLVAGVQSLLRDVGDGFHRAGHAGADGVMLIQGAQQIDEHRPVGVVLDHADLLADDPPLLLHALPGEIGDRDEGEQGPQIFLEMLGGLKIVAGDGVAGEGVGRGSVGCQLLKGVASRVSNILCSK